MLTCLLWVVLTVFSCVNPIRVLDEGDYTRAYELSKRQIDRRLKRHKALKPEQCIALHGSYRQWQDELTRQVTVLADNTDSARWLRLHALYAEMLALRRDIAAYETVVPDLVFNYDIASLERLTERARVQAADYCYGQAQQRLTAARQGHKQSAREAHHWLSRSLEYAPERLEYQPLLAEMDDLGTVRLLVSPLAGGHSWQGATLAEYFNRRQQACWRRDWLEVCYRPTDRRIDYYVETEVFRASVSPDLEDRDRDCYEKKVQDGTKTVEEEIKQGDSTVVIRKQVPIMITVRGCITTVQQYKEAGGALRVHLYPAQSEYATQSWELYGYENWQNEFEICEGDARALPKCCYGSCQIYPSNHAMLCDVANTLQHKLRSSLLRHFSDTQISRQNRGFWAWLSEGS